MRIYLKIFGEDDEDLWEKWHFWWEKRVRAKEKKETFVLVFETFATKGILVWKLVMGHAAYFFMVWWTLKISQPNDPGLVYHGA